MWKRSSVSVAGKDGTLSLRALGIRRTILRMICRLPMTAMAGLAAAACNPQTDNGQLAGTKLESVAHEQRPLIDACDVALHPERFAGQRIRLRGIAVQDIEYLSLTMPGCMQRRWDGKVYVDARGGWNVSEIENAVMEARRRSTATRQFAAQGDFEGVVRATRRGTPRNVTETIPEFVPMFEVEKVEHVRLVEFPA